MTDPESIIARCTRGGITSWQQVAKMLGISREKARALYGHHCKAIPISLNPPGIGPVDAIPAAETLTDAQAYRSPRLKTDGHSMLILVMLRRRRQSAEDLAAASSFPLKSTRARLSEMKADGTVTNDGMIPYTWTLTDFGREVLARENANTQSRERA
jgi:hypothetical protein